MAALYTWCPECGCDFNDIDYEYQVCSHCGWHRAGKQEQASVAPREKHGPKKRTAGTNYQREIFIQLFAGCIMGKYGNRYRLWDKRRNPLRRFSVSTFLQVKKYCREKNGGWVIDVRKVRALRKNTWLKQYYLTLKNKQ